MYIVNYIPMYTLNMSKVIIEFKETSKECGNQIYFEINRNDAV